jgi:hypothetical protein
MAIRTRVASGESYIAELGVIRVPDDGKLTELISTALVAAVNSIIRKFNGYISLGSGDSGSWAGNIDAQYLDVYFKAANTEVEIPHGIGRIPTGYDVTLKDRACDVYTSSLGSWSDTMLLLKCTVAGSTVRLRVY